MILRGPGSAGSAAAIFEATTSVLTILNSCPRLVVAAALLLSLLTAGLGLEAPVQAEEQSMELSAADKKTLHEIARQSIAAGLQGQPPPLLPPVSGVLQEPRGAFVTLHHRGQLRGCIGYIEAVKPLAQTVQEMAAAAAFKDPRFPPLTPEEFQDIQIEISVLSPLRRIHSIDEIEVGRHGLYIRRGLRHGLLLPQVATEHHWDRFTFLQQTCWKANLPTTAWQDPQTEIYIFSADIF
jgi:AmmeMemoRadiSam system protein A